MAEPKSPLETNVDVSFQDMADAVIDSFARIQSGMNPSKSINRRRIIRSTHFDMNEYIQPSRIFDIKRLWKNETKKNRKPGRKHQIKINPMKGFQDPLKLRKKCLVKMPSVPGVPFVLIYDESPYIPPAFNVPAHILSVERNLPKLTRSPMFHETEVLGKYINPCFLKPKVKTRVKSRPLQLVKEAHKIPDFPEEFAREKYHAPPGSKENFTCRNCPDITAADKALDDVSIFMNSRTIRNAPHGDLNNFSSLTEQLVKNLEGDVDCLADDYEWTKFHLHRGSSLQFSESESEADPLASIAEFKNFEDVMARDASSKLRSSETGDGIDYPNEDCQSLLSSPPAKENLTIEIINMTKDKPHIVRRIIKESQSVSEWLEEKIISVHSDSCLEKYRPPSLYEMTKSGSTLQPKLRHETYKALKAKSCCTFGCKSESSEFLLQTTKPDSTISDKSLDILKQRSKCHNVTPLTAINSVDDVLQLRTVNPVGFCIWRALCSKKLDLYAYKSECRPHSIDEFDTQASICKFKKFSARRLSRGDDESDQTGYLGSEEDEEYKCQILNDFWPIRSQCTTKDSEPSIPDFSKDLHAVNRDQNQSAAPANIIFIDCDGSEYWSCKSAYEDIFYPFHAHVQNSDDGRTTFSLHNNNGNADSCKIRKQSHIQQTRLGRCISKLATWCKNGLLKNL